MKNIFHFYSSRNTGETSKTILVAFIGKSIPYDVKSLDYRRRPYINSAEASRHSLHFGTSMLIGYISVLL